MMDKIDVNGANTHPVWAFLKAAHPGDVSWNFAAKFIIDKEGNVVERNSSGAGDSRPLIESLRYESESDDDETKENANVARTN